MFPNLRLMIVAVAASILGIGCALGLFAEFRVSHDSFLRESNANAPLQLGVGDVSPGRVVNTAAPFEFRFQAPPPSDVFETAGGSEASDQATIVATPQPAPQAETAAAPTPDANAPATLTVTSTTEPAAGPGSSDRATETPSPSATGSIANQNARQDIPPDNPQNTEPEAEGDLAVQTPATSPAVGTTVPKAEIAPAHARTAGRWRAPLRRKPSIVRRAQRTWSATPTQDFTSLQPSFQWTLQPASQSRRRIIRRVRPVRKPVAQTATPQTTVSNTQPLDTPE